MQKKFLLEKILTTGAEGMVGSYVNFGIKTDVATLDVTDQKAVKTAFKKYKPEIILHLAAQTDVDKCQREPVRAYKINTFGTFNIAAASREFKAKMVYISTSAVFDGKKNKPYTEKDVPNPQSVYARTKHLGEIIVRDIVPEYLILRAGWMFGGGPQKDKKFVAKIIKQLEKPEIKAVNDIIGSPTFAKDLIEAVKTLLKEKRTGLYHIINEGVCSRYDMAQEIVKTLKPSIKVTPVTSEYFNLAAPRGTEALISELKIMQPWQGALKEYLLKEWKPNL